jgi:hypothetical protein
MMDNDDNFGNGTWKYDLEHGAGSLKALTQQLQKYQMQITAVQETNWMENEIWNTKTHTVFQSGKSNGKREFGVAFIVNKEMKKNILGFTPVSERICRLRVKTKFFNLSGINVNAPTEDKDETNKDEFYSQLGRTYDSAPSNDIKIIIGDLNANLGKEEMYKGTIGKQSLHIDSNDNGKRIIDFAMSRNLVISSTCFPHKAIHKGTWRSPDGKTYNQIDHVLIDRRNASSIIDVRTCRGANGDSDHYLVKAVYRCRIMAWKDGHMSKEPKINIQKLGNPEVREAYQKLLGEKLTQQEHEDDIDKERKRSCGGSNNSTGI